MSGACPNCEGVHATTAEMIRCYADFNRKLRIKHGSAPPAAADDATRPLAYSVRCSVCGAHGPAGATIYSGARLAQQQGYTHDSESMRAGRPLTWFCGTCGGKRARAAR